MQVILSNSLPLENLVFRWCRESPATRRRDFHLVLVQL